MIIRRQDYEGATVTTYAIGGQLAWLDHDIAHHLLGVDKLTLVQDEGMIAEVDYTPGDDGNFIFLSGVNKIRGGYLADDFRQVVQDVIHGTPSPIGNGLFEYRGAITARQCALGDDLQTEELEILAEGYHYMRSPIGVMLTMPGVKLVAQLSGVKHDSIGELRNGEIATTQRHAAALERALLVAVGTKAAELLDDINAAADTAEDFAVDAMAELLRAEASYRLACGESVLADLALEASKSRLDFLDVVKAVAEVARSMGDDNG